MILRYTAGSTHILGPCAPYARLKIHRNSSRRSVFPSPVDEAKGQLEMNRVWMHEYVGYRGVCSQTPAHQPVSWMACPYLLSLQVGRHCCIVWLFSRTAPLFLHTATMCQNEFGSFLFAIAKLLYYLVVRIYEVLFYYLGYTEHCCGRGVLGESTPLLVCTAPRRCLICLALSPSL